MTRLQESRTVEISVYGLTRGVGLTTHSYSLCLLFRRSQGSTVMATRKGATVVIFET